MLVSVTHLVLDVLKPHAPDGVTFTTAMAERCGGQSVRCRVLERDEKTETVEVTIEGSDLQVDAIKAVIADLGASLHSIDEVMARICSARE